jgi:hypothetical protein
MSKNRGKSKLSKNVLFNANKHVFHCEKSLATLFYDSPHILLWCGLIGIQYQNKMPLSKLWHCIIGGIFAWYIICPTAQNVHLNSQNNISVLFNAELFSDSLQNSSMCCFLCCNIPANMSSDVCPVSQHSLLRSSSQICQNPALFILTTTLILKIWKDVYCIMLLSMCLCMLPNSWKPA